jgi:PHD/YefM family antitoxin component YafN of YafNO toxin-antitoxin module
MKGKKLPKSRYVVTGSDEGPVIITNEGWKLRFYNSQKIYELYNLKKDPEEKYNVILRFPEIAEKLKKTLLEECKGNIANGVLYY